ncbi:hypothetical protein NYO98_09905 [Nocardioides sp. STR2]|uniref:Uncharacterized protein n=1 Tax=Nocardioides pini TaxID=2975053 RepID=A0ABT4CC99_9ACTN|nr:hypothetical protein [Nocardioides pini]MCY4726590.1 hypothetical protein [Nocardioides pini]
MSEQLTSQSRSNESGITRRTALRGAAWSVSAVTVVVATPNIAAASGGATGTGGASSANRQGNNLEITSSLTAGPVALSSIEAMVTVSFATVGPTIASTSLKGQSQWKATGKTDFTATFTLGSLAAGTNAAFEPILGLQNASSVAGSFSIKYTWSGNVDGDTVGGTFTKN